MCLPRRNPPRRGLSMVEMLLAMTIMVIMVGALGALSMTIETGSRHSQGHTDAAQHARVAIQRIETALREAQASASFPGFFVYSEQVGSWSFPDTLVIWRPSGAAADPDGLPRVRELVVFAPDPTEPNRLMEMTLPGDSSTAPSLDDDAGWGNTINSFKNSGSARHVQLTDLLRVAEADDGNPRGVVRFNVTVSPSMDDWSEFELGNIDWNDLDWPQGVWSTQSGMRQTACHFELQLMPGAEAQQDDSEGQTALPFIGSAALYHQLEKP